MKRTMLSAGIAAAVMITAIQALSCQAEFETRLVGSGTYKGLLVETDGTAFTEAMAEGISGYAGIEYWEVYSHDHDIQCCPANQDIAVSGTEFMLLLDTNDGKTLTQLGRKLLLEQDCITDVSIVDYSNYIDYYVEYEIKEVLDEYSGEYREMMIIYAEEPLAGSGSTKYSMRSVFRSAGDVTRDSRINASDAAAILMDAAETGAGLESSISTMYGDINADGHADSQDAQYILRYAAEAGTGSTPAWQAILRSEKNAES